MRPQITSSIIRPLIHNTGLLYPQITHAKGVPNRYHSYQPKSRFRFSNTKAPLEFVKTKTLPFTPLQFFSVVLQVESYSEFLPWCTKSQAYDINVIDKNEGKFKGQLTVSFMQMDFTYNSIVKWKQPNFIESTVQKSQIFDQLRSTWIIRPKIKQPKTQNNIQLKCKGIQQIQIEKNKIRRKGQIQETIEQECEIEYKLQMKFKNSIYSALANQFLDLWTNKINTAFEKRCEDLFKLKNQSTEIKFPFTESRAFKKFNEYFKQGGLWNWRPVSRTQSPLKNINRKTKRLPDMVRIQQKLKQLTQLDALEPIQEQKILELMDQNDKFFEDVMILEEVYFNMHIHQDQASMNQNYAKFSTQLKNMLMIQLSEF